MGVEAASAIPSDGAASFAASAVDGRNALHSSMCADSIKHYVVVRSLPPELEHGVCNPSDRLADALPDGAKLLWYLRHGQSIGHVAREAAMEADKKAGGGSKHEEACERSLERIDCPLSPLGEQQALWARAQVAAWKHKPYLLVCSPFDTGPRDSRDRLRA
mmetsp:Transcript_31814/g.93000  ORF Transcript_31814/g.93000 Transcript_31814/m.93000 type:complete len:161 (+) Transcript_31814:41-523(+)